MVVPLALAPEYRVPAIGAWLIFLLTVCIAIGADLGGGKPCVQDPKIKVPGWHCKPLLHLGLLFSGLSFVGVLLSIANALKAYSLDLSVPSLLALGHLLSTERYSGGDQPPLLVRALVIWVFPAALLGGMGLSITKTTRDRMVCLVCLLPALAASTIQAARANTVMVVVLAVGGYWGMKAAGGDAQRIVTRKAGLVVAALIVSGLSFFFAVDSLRVHKQQEEEIQTNADWARAKSTSLGYLAVFSHWANGLDGLGSSHLSLGVFTFGGVLEVVGLHSRETGIYTESIDLEGGDVSNIYTAFRGLIEDFSLPGAAVFCFLAGLLSGRAYSNSQSEFNPNPIVMAGFYAFLIWSPLGSLFIYNGSILALLVGWLVTKRLTTGVYTRISSSGSGEPGL